MRSTRVAFVVLAALVVQGSPVAQAARAGGVIVFSRLDAGRYHLYSIRPDGGGVTQLTQGPYDDTEADVARDGRIVFARGWGTVPRGPYTQLYVRERNGAEHPVFSSRSATADYFPRWSPDGRRIAFTRANPGGEASPLPNNAAVYVVNANGTGLRALTPASGFGFATWSPDGRHIAFNGPAAGGIFVLYTMDVQARRPVMHAIMRKDAYQPRWSPDGMWIAFTSTRDGGGWQVYITHPDGRGQHRLTFAPGHEDKFPSWSPDARSIVFESTRDNPCPTPAGAWCRIARLYVMRADGRSLRELTAGPADAYADWAR
jgi:Tol biopolymer transport system component